MSSRPSRVEPVHYVLSGLYAVYFAFLGGFTAYFALFLQSSGFTAPQIGGVLSLVQACRAVSPLLWGWVADRSVCLRRVLMCSLIGACCVFSSVLFWQSPRSLGLLLGLFALFFGGCMPILETMTLSYLKASPQRYPHIRLWGSIGYALTIFVWGFVFELIALTWLPVMLLFTLLLMLPLVFYIPTQCQSIRHHEQSAQTASTCWTFWRWIMSGGFCLGIAHGVLYGFYSIRLSELGWTGGMIGLMWTLGVGAEILLFLVLPRTLWGENAYRLLTIGLGCAVVRFFIIGHFGDSLLLLLLAQLLHAGSFGAYHAGIMQLINQSVSVVHRAKMQSLYASVVHGLGGMVGAGLAGMVWISWGGGRVFMTAAGIALLGLVLTGVAGYRRRLFVDA